jgi:hypothetical protein
MKSRRRTLAGHMECKTEKNIYIEAFGEEIRNEIPVWKIRRKMKKIFGCIFRK